MIDEYIYTNRSTATNSPSSITSSDIVLLNGNNILHSVDQQYDGINPIASFTVVKSISAMLSNQLLNIEDELSQHEAKLSNNMLYFGSFTKGYVDEESQLNGKILSGFLRDNLNLQIDGIIERGTMFKFISAVALSDSIDIDSAVVEMFNNDYIIFNKNVAIVDAKISDFDIIRDSQIEVEKLSNDVYSYVDEKLPTKADISSLNAKLDSTSICPAWQKYTWYYVGDMISYEGKILSANYEVGDEPFDIRYWDEVDVKSLLNVKADSSSLTAYEPISSLYNDVSSIVLSSASEWVKTNQSDWDFSTQPEYRGNNIWSAEFRRSGDFANCYAEGDENATQLHFDDGYEIDVQAEKIASGNALGIVTFDYLSTELSTKQDKLTDIQLSSIDYVANEQMTTIKFIDGTSEKVEIVGEINQVTLDPFVGRGITDIKLGTLVNAIGNDTFGNFSALSNVFIPETVRIINDYAFVEDSNLSTLTIPNGVSSIGIDAFLGSDNLTVTFIGKTMNEVSSMANYSWGLNASNIKTWNAASQEDLSTELSTIEKWVKDNYSAVYIKNPKVDEYKNGKKDDLSVINLTNAEYAYLLSTNTAQPNALYVISNDFRDAYGQQIKNVQAATDLSDAINFEQLKAAIAQCLQLSGGFLSGDLSVENSLFVNGAQFGITTKEEAGETTTVANTVADEINFSISSESQASTNTPAININKQYITFSQAAVNIEATSSFVLSVDSQKVIDATSSQVEILSVLSVGTENATITKLSVDQLSVSSFKNITNGISSLSDMLNNASNEISELKTNIANRINELSIIDDLIDASTIEDVISAVITIRDVLSSLKTL